MSVRQSISFSILDKYATQGLLLLTTAVMARLLTPAETGLYLIANSFVLLADNFRTFGAGIYVVNVDELRQSTLRAAFTVTCLISSGLFVAILAVAGWIGDFYNEARLADLLRLAGLAFLIAPFATPIVAVLQRELRFGALARINVLTACVNSLVTVALAFAGFGPESYIWGYLTGIALLSILAFWTYPHPGIFVPTLKDAGKILQFGSLSASVTVLNMTYDLLPRLALGRILSVDAVGLYGRALTVCQLPDRFVVSAAHPVVLPAMSQKVRKGEALADIYLRGHALLSGIQWPALLLLALLADPVVRMLLGEQWLEATPMVRLIAIGMMALAPAFMTFPVLVASGRMRDTLLSTVISLPPSMALILVAAQFGIVAVAGSTLINAPVQMAIAFWFVSRAIGTSWRALLRASLASAGLTVATAVGPVIVVLLSPRGFELNWVETTLAIVAAGAGWLTAACLSTHPIMKEISGLAVVGRNGFRMLRRRAGPGSTIEGAEKWSS